MKLSEYLSEVGRPIAYYPGLRKITGSTTATIFFCQFFYWTGKESSGDGWIYKTAKEIEEETGLSYNEQKTAREKLKSAKLLKEKYHRLDHEMYFKIDLDKLNELWGTIQPEIPECDDSTLGNDESPYSLNSNTETTTEIKEIHLNEKTKKKGDLVDGYLFFAGQAVEQQIEEVEDCLIELEKGLHRNIPRLPAWQDLAKWIIKQGNLKEWIKWYMSDKFRVENAWRMKPQQIKDSWPQAQPKVIDDYYKPYVPEPHPEYVNLMEDK